jgi:hypothetical protein
MQRVAQRCAASRAAWCVADPGSGLLKLPGSGSAQQHAMLLRIAMPQRVRETRLAAGERKNSSQKY